MGMSLYSNIRRIFWNDRNIWKTFRSFEKTKKMIDNAFSEITFFQINLNHRLNVTWIIFLYRWSFVVLVLESVTSWIKICVELISRLDLGILVFAVLVSSSCSCRLALAVSLSHSSSRHAASLFSDFGCALSLSLSWSHRVGLAV